MAGIIPLNFGPGPIPERTLEVIEGTEEERARNVARKQAFWANMDWLSSHWDTLLPGARGKWVAVANQTAFVAETPDEARVWIAAQQPVDPGAVLKHVTRHKEVRTRADQR